MSDTRERLLDALEAVVAEDGPAGATLEAVAARAGVSKGGLLYHFKSKEALMTGLADRLRLYARDEATGWTGPDGDVARGYLDSSAVATAPYTTTLMAMLRLLGADSHIERAIADSFGVWAKALSEHLDDPVLARLIALAGDGLYLHALVGMSPDATDRAVMDRLVSMVGEDYEGRGTAGGA